MVEDTKMINFPSWADSQACNAVCLHNTEPTIKTKSLKSSICSGQPPSNMADILNQLVKSDPETVVCNSLDEVVGLNKLNFLLIWF